MNKIDYESALIEVESVCAEIYIVATMMNPQDAIDHILGIFDKRYSKEKPIFEESLRNMKGFKGDDE